VKTSMSGLSKDEAACILSVIDDRWNDVARIRWRFAARVRRIVEPSEFSRKLRRMEREGLVVSSRPGKSGEAQGGEGVLWRRKE
jgi:hypothetical protein